jgi:biotin carboxylase
MSHVCVLRCPAVTLLQYATRTCLAAAGLPSPRNARISMKADVAAAADKVGFPAVIKPVSGW